MVVFTKAQLPGSSMSLASTETGSGCPRDKNTERKYLITHKQHCTSCKGLPHCFVLGTEETLNLCAVINSKNRLIKKKMGKIQPCIYRIISQERQIKYENSRKSNYYIFCFFVAFVCIVGTLNFVIYNLPCIRHLNLIIISLLNEVYFVQQRMIY